jgi:phosphomannomutase
MNFDIISQKKILVADVDDTVAQSTMPLESEMAQLITRLINKGYWVVFISGSTVEELFRQISCKVFPEHHLLGTSGTRYVKVVNGIKEECYNYLFSDSESEFLEKICFELVEKYKVEPMTDRKDQIQDRGSQFTFSALGRHAPSEIKKNFDPQGKIRESWAEFLRGRLGVEWNVAVGGTTSIDITRKGQDKAWGLKEFAKYRNLKLEDMFFLGDKLMPGGNDYPLAEIVYSFQVSGPQETLEILKKLV